MSNLETWMDQSPVQPPRSNAVLVCAIVVIAMLATALAIAPEIP